MPKRIFHHLLSLRQLKRWSSSLWPLFLLIGIIAILVFLNYQPGTWLTGWDNLHTEFNFPLNLKNAIFSVWQEKGTGFLAGMSPAADLPRILFLYLLSTVYHLPSFVYRYLWNFICLFIGPISTYLLIHHIFLKSKFDQETKKIASFLGALFYLLNLATIQYFFIPFESFSTFFAFFPLIFLATTFFFEKASFKHYLFLLFVLIISSPAFFVQTLFVVLSICLLPLLLQNLKHGKIKIFVFIFSLVATQSYWLLPQIFFVFTHAKEVSQSHVNLLSSIETLYRNLQFANLKDLALLKGFWFNILDPNGDNKFDYLFLVWRNHLANPLITIIGYLTFGLVITGIIYSLKKKLPFAKSFLTIFLVCVFSLLGGVQIIGTEFPILGELFRSPFTKFSIPLAFTFAIFFSVGVIFLFDIFSYLHHRLTYLLTIFTVGSALIIFMTPAFTGNLVSPQMRVKIPSEYEQLFDFFKDQDPATRIANFPQYVIWGWNYYHWGYRGAGFLWYGIRQPILDRGFDVWEKSSERYFEEISNAVYSEDQAAFDNLIDKYAVNWLLLDKDIITYSTNTDIGLTKLQKLIDNSNKFTLAKNFNDKILVYQAKPDLASPDKTVKNFMSVRAIHESPLQPSTAHPFADLPLRPQPLSLDSNGSLTLTSYLPNFVNSSLTIPNYLQAEKLVPVSISYKKTILGLTLKFEPILPSLKIDDKQINLTSLPSYLDFPLTTLQSGFILAINDQFFELQLPEELPYQSTYYPITTTYLSTTDHLRASLYANSPYYSLNLTSAFSSANPIQCFTDKPNRKIEKIVTQDTVSLFGTDVVGCLSAPVPQPNDLNSLITLDLIYNSPTNTPANASISTLNLSGLNSPQPLIAKKTNTFARFYAKPIFEPLQANLILEANEAKSAQEVNYKNITVSYLPLLAESDFTLNGNPAQQISMSNLPAGRQVSNVAISIPIIESPLTVNTNPSHNLLSPEAINCDNFNHDKFEKRTDKDGTLYTAINSNSCDNLNLRHLPHSTSYVIIFDQKAIEGLPTTYCLENYSTRRCDIFERMDAKLGQQFVYQPIVNPNEELGYSLHLFNQSFGNRPTNNLIRSITVSPYPLNFLKNITITDSSQLPKFSDSQLLNTSHPAEFLYTATVINNLSSTLSLYQTKSPYWKAIEVSPDDLTLPLWSLIAKLPFLYYSSLNTKYSLLDTDSWYNSWQIPPGNHNVVIFYLPQYLEFLGFLLLPLPFLATFIYFIIRRLKKKS